MSSIVAMTVDLDPEGSSTDLAKPCRSGLSEPIHDAIGNGGVFPENAVLETRMCSGSSLSRAGLSEDDVISRADDIPPEPALSPPLDGGYGWVIVAVSFLVNAVVEGLLASFGIFLPHLVSHFDSSQGSTAFIGSVMAGVFLLVGPLAAAGVNLLGCRVVTVTGALLTTASLIVSITSPSVGVMTFTFGLIGGTGVGLLYLPAMVLVGYYFEKRRALATGIACSGSGVGVLVMAPFSAALLQEYDWQSALVLLSAWSVQCVACGALMRPLEANYKTFSNVNYQTKNCDKTKSVAVSSSEHTQGFHDREGELGAAKSESRVISPDPKSSEEWSPHPNRSRPQVTNGVINSLNSPKSDVSHSALLMTSQEQQTSSCLNIHQGSPFLLSPARRHLSNISHLGSASCRSLSRAHLSPPQSLTFKPQTTPLSSPMLRKDIFYSGSIHALTDHGACKDGDPAPGPTRHHVSTYNDLSDGVEHVALRPSALAEHGDRKPGSASGRSRLSRQGALAPMKEMMDISILRNKAFLSICLAQTVLQLGYFIPIVFLPNFAISLGVGEKDSALLVSIFGVCNMVGRAGAGVLSTLVGTQRLHLNNLSLVAAGVLCGLAALLATDFTGLVVFASLYGLMIAVFVPLTTVFLVEFVGLQKLTNAFGILCMSKGLISPLGPPIAGAMLDWTGSYPSVFYLAGSLFVTAGLIQYTLPCLRCVRQSVGDSRSDPVHTALSPLCPAVCW